MIIKNLKLKHNSSVAKLSLGRQGEHGATCVEIDVGDFRDKFGAGRAELLFCPPYESESFPVPIDKEEDTYKWTITESVTHKAGVGMATLRWYVGDDLAKSCSIECYVQSSADGKIGEMPDVIKDWLDHLMENLPQGGGMSPAEIKKAIADYLEQNPVETLTEAQITAIVSAYVIANKDSLKGDKGDKGDTGERGSDGAKGDTGERGEKGEKGDTGEKGADGQNGADGKDGVDGKDYVLTEADKQDIANLVPTHEPVTDDHINSLIDAKLTPIESLVDEIAEVVG